MSYVILFVATIIASSILSYFLNFAFTAGILGFTNHVFGGVFGLVRGFLINLVLIFLVQLTPLKTQPWWQQSQIVIAYQPAAQWLTEKVSPIFAQLEAKAQIQKTLQDTGSKVLDMVQ